MASIPTITQKQGTTLQLAMQASNADATPIDLSGVVVSAEVRNPFGHLIATLAIVNGGPSGALTIAQDTTDWPVGTLQCDLKFVTAATGVIVKTETFQIAMIRAVTA